jgi:hypothetical protein
MPLTSWALAAAALACLVPIAATAGDVPVYTHRVTDFEAAANDGKDDTGAFQRALDAAYGAGGGIVHAPAGHYHFRGNLTVPPGVTLRGDWRPPSPDGLGDVTVLNILAGKGKEDGPAFLSLPNSCCVRDLTFFYPDQSASNITPYPYTIALTNVDTGTYKGHAFCTMVHRVTLVNSYRGILVANGHLHFLKRIVGTPLKQGIYMNVCSDIGRMAECDFRADVWIRSGLRGAPVGAAAAKALRDYLFRNGTACTVGYSDTEILTNIRARGYRVGLRLVGYRNLGVRKGRPARTNSYGQAYGLELLSCWRSLQADSVQSQVGYEISASRFTAADCCVWGTGGSGIQFNTCEFSTGPEGTAVHAPLDRERRAELTLQHCTFDTWGKAAVAADAGTVSVVDCDFKSDKPCADIGAGVSAALMLGNRFKAKQPAIRNACKRALIDHTPQKFAQYDGKPYVYASVPRPGSDRILDVGDERFKARADAETDDTGAIQKALDALRGKGGTVFLPAGKYRVDGTLAVPSGVELRGIWDGCARPAANTHGTLLVTTRDKGNEKGAPLIKLAARAGLRGIAVLYPEQNDYKRVLKYPWTVQARGDGCYLVGVDLMNPYQGIDLTGDDHLISNLYMTALGLGLSVHDSRNGRIEDYHVHPQFWGLNVVGGYGLPNHKQSIQCMKAHGICLRLANCVNETIANFSTWMAKIGMQFAGKETSARIINPTFDQVVVCYTVSGTADLQVVNTQGGYLCVQTAPGFAGKAQFFNSLWRGETHPLDLRGPGTVVMQQDLFRKGSVPSLDGGILRMEGGIQGFGQYRFRHKPERVEIVGTIDRGGAVKKLTGDVVTKHHNLLP